MADEFESFLDSWCREYSGAFPRRAMADLAFLDSEGFYSVIDIKTHRTDTRFSMPNLTSVERLSRFYQSDRNVFSLIMIKYEIDGTSLKVSDVLFSPIEFLDWACLRVGALGWGQIQIANSNNIQTREGFSRKDWMLQFCDLMMEFYPREIGKIKARMQRFEQAKAYWANKENAWAE